MASDQFGYDANLRPLTTTASWQSGSGSSGAIFSQTRTYDPASNVLSVSNTQAAVPGQSGSGGSETQLFCYDEQNRLVWAGNNATPPLLAMAPVAAAAPVTVSTEQVTAQAMLILT